MQENVPHDPVLTRRQALSLYGSAVVAGYRPLFGAATHLAPASGLLKKRIKGRTINVHTHLSAAPYAPGTRGAVAPRKRVPDKDLPPLTSQDREDAHKYFTRFQYGLIEFDSPRQEDLYMRKYIYYLRKNRPAMGFEENALRFLAEMDEAGIDTSVLLVSISPARA